jgi:hypothetical protein
VRARCGEAEIILTMATVVRAETKARQNGGGVRASELRSGGVEWGSRRSEQGKVARGI